MAKTRVYIVFRHASQWDDYSGNEFIGVFFNVDAARALIAKKQNHYDYFIEVYEEPDPGQEHEVFC